MHNFTYFAGSDFEFSPKLNFAAEIAYENINDLQLLEELLLNKDKVFNKNNYITMRVDCGEIELNYDEKNAIALNEYSFYFTQMKFVKSVKCNTVGTRIRIYIFEIDKIPDRFTTEKIYHIKNTTEELELSSEIIKCNEIYNSDNNTFANILFSLLIFRCIKSHNEKELQFFGIYAKEIGFAVDYIDNNLYNKISFSDLSKKLNLSDRNFRKVFKEYIGISPKSYMQKRRMEIAAVDLKKSALTISQISDKLGYYSPFQFSRDFKKYYNINPSNYKQLYK